MTVDTRKAPRRTLTFASLDDISRELDRLEAAHRAGRLKATGNWTPGEIFDHLALSFRLSLDGFPAHARPPALLKWIVRTFFKKNAVAGVPPPPGIKSAKAADIFAPRPGISFDDGLSELRSQIARVTTGGERMVKPSPLFGDLTHDQWTGLHRGHTALHLGFLDPGA